MTPIGALALVFADPVVLRWIISALVLMLLAVLASGWRYHGRPPLPLMAAVGAASGLGSGAGQVAGPPAILFWARRGGGRGRRAPGRRVRARRPGRRDHGAGEADGVLRAAQRRGLHRLSGA